MSDRGSPTPPPVSVYLPTRDRLALLRRAVASVQAQTLADFELIVVDDGSTDGTRQWLAGLAREDTRVKVLHAAQPSGAPRARNMAIRAARGEWITGLDDDDEFLPARLASLLAMARAMDAAGVAFSALYTQDEVVTGPQRRHVTRKPDRADLERLFAGNCMGNQVFVRPGRLLEIGLYDESLPAWQDLDLAMRLVHRFGPARLVDAPLYRLHDDERADRISRKRKTDILAAWRCLHDRWPQFPRHLHQRLYLQVLGGHYGFPIDARDLRTLASLGLSPGALRRLWQTLWVRRHAAAQRDGTA